MGEAYSMQWKEEKCTNNFGPKMRIEETNWNI
jgi:hypothetical protein